MMTNQKSKQMTIIDRLALLLTAIAIWIVFLVFGWIIFESAADSETKYYSDADILQKPLLFHQVFHQTGADVSDGKLCYGFDCHGGFHGDGDMYLEIQMPYSIDDKLENTSEWYRFPASENIRKACDLYIDKHNGKDSEPIIPEVQNGWWYFLDRSSDNSFDFPLNFTLAVYDSDTDMIYYCEHDI